ncbi:hypothetical protein C8J57DRAFT_1247239 [Mycena rebaudengoi]|nr:hypothetical protein C8J57DRAFT_1247239 [Mycena rebaudengoi]
MKLLCPLLLACDIIPMRVAQNQEQHGPDSSPIGPILSLRRLYLWIIIISRVFGTYLRVRCPQDIGASPITTQTFPIKMPLTLRRSRSTVAPLIVNDLGLPTAQEAVAIEELGRCAAAAAAAAAAVSRPHAEQPPLGQNNGQPHPGSQVYANC